jgi:hypothetical protein
MCNRVGEFSCNRIIELWKTHPPTMGEMGDKSLAAVGETPVDIEIARQRLSGKAVLFEGV